MMLKRVLLLMVVLGTISILAQDDQEEDCDAVVREAFMQVMEICEPLGRDQACYGNVYVEASPRGNISNFVFETQGDIEDVIHIERLQLRADSVIELGVAVMQIRANIRDDRTENVTLLLMGDTVIQNDSDVTVELPAIIAEDTRVRSRPVGQSATLGSLAAGDDVLATGRYTDEFGADWIRVRFLGDARRNGWVVAGLFEAGTDFSALPDVEYASRGLGPMQAFTVTSGNDDRVCQQAPDSGLLIQTPEGVGEISLLVNEVDIQLGSTAYIHTTDDERMMVYLLEGRAFVTANGVSQAVYAGMQTEIQLGEDGATTGTPRFPRAYDAAQLSTLPVYALPRPIRIAPPRFPATATPTSPPVPERPRVTLTPSITPTPTATPTATIVLPG